MAKKAKKNKIHLNKEQREMGKRNLFILLTLAVFGAALLIVGTTFS